MPIDPVSHHYIHATIAI